VTNTVLIPLPGIGTLALSREAFEAALAEGSKAMPVPARTAADEEPWLTAEQLGAAMSLPPSWLERAGLNGRVPSITAGRWRRFRRSAVEQALQSKTPTGASHPAGVSHQHIRARRTTAHADSPTTSRP
jgi:hypothetical protein